MARARLLKPGFFKNENLTALPPMARLLFAGLWTIADKAGRLEDRPRRIKGELFPYENVPVEKHLAALESAGFIDRYEVEGYPFIQITNFLKHQTPHTREPESVIPPNGTSPVPVHDEPDAETEDSLPDPSVAVDGNRYTETVTETVDGDGSPRPDPLLSDQDAQEIRSAFQNRIGVIPFSAIEEFREYIRFTPKDWFLDAIEVTRKDAKTPCWAFCKKVIDAAMARNQPPGARYQESPQSLSDVLARRQEKRRVGAR